jgi:hypothetical protein
MRTATRSHRQLTAFGSSPDPLQACRRWQDVHCLRGIMYIEAGITGSLSRAVCQLPDMQSTTTNSFGVGDSIVPPGSQKNAATGSVTP